MMPFAEKLAAVQTQKQTDRALILQPRLLEMPLPIQKFDDPFLPFGKAIIDATYDLVCAYLFDLASYMAIGAAGVVALERTIAYAKVRGNAITILDVPFASAEYTHAAGDNAFDVHAVTVSESAFAAPYARALGGGVFVVGKGEPNDSMTPDTFGILYRKYGRAFTRLNSNTVLHIRLYGDDVVYAGRSFDFEEQIRVALESKLAWRHF